MAKKQKTAERMSWCEAFEYLHCTGRELWDIIVENGLPVYSQDGIYRYYHHSLYNKTNICTNPHVFIWAIDFNPATELIKPISLEPNIPCNPMDEPSMPFPSDAGCDRYSFPEAERIILENKFGEMWINLTDGFCCFIRQPLIKKKDCDAWFRCLTGKDCEDATHIPTSEPRGICFASHYYIDKNGELEYQSSRAPIKYGKTPEYKQFNDNRSNYSKKAVREANKRIRPLLHFSDSIILKFTYRLRSIQTSNTDNNIPKEILIRIDSSYQKYIYQNYIYTPFPYRQDDGLSMQFQTYPMEEGVRVPPTEALKYVTQSENINPRKFVSQYVTFSERLAIFNQANNIQDDLCDWNLMEEHCEQGYEARCLPTNFSSVSENNLTNDFFFKAADLNVIRQQREQKEKNIEGNKNCGTEELQSLSTDDLKKLVILEKILTDIEPLFQEVDIRRDIKAFRVSLRYYPLSAIAKEIYPSRIESQSTYITKHIKALPSKIIKLYEELNIIPRPPKNYKDYQENPGQDFWHKIGIEDLMKCQIIVDKIKKDVVSSSETEPTGT